MAADFAAWSTYNYVLGNPIIFVDPTGKAPEWIDNKDGTYTAEAGDSAASLAKDAGISNTFANALVENQLGSNYIGADGGLKSNVEIGNKVNVGAFQYSWSSPGGATAEDLALGYSPSSGTAGGSAYQLGFTLSVGSPMTIVLGGGIAFDNSGNVRPYGTAGFGHGMDISLGVEFNASFSSDPNFSIFDLNGSSVMYNAGAAIYDAGYGTDVHGQGASNYGANKGATYKTFSGGLSAGIPIGATRTVESTKVFFSPIKKTRVRNP